MRGYACAIAGLNGLPCLETQNHQCKVQLGEVHLLKEPQMLSSMNQTKLKSAGTLHIAITVALHVHTKHFKNVQKSRRNRSRHVGD